MFKLHICTAEYEMGQTDGFTDIKFGNGGSEVWTTEYIVTSTEQRFIEMVYWH